MKTQQERFSVSQHWLPVLLFLAGMILTLSAYISIKGELDSHRQTEVSWEVRNRSNALKKGIEEGLESVKTMRDLFRSSEHVTQAEFSLFAKALLARYRGIHALEWIAAIRHDNIRTDEPSPESVVRIAANFSNQFLLLYIEPLPENGQSLGFDYASMPHYRELMEQAGDSGQLTVSGRIELVRNNNPQYGFIAIQPVYANAMPLLTRSQRQTALLGLALGVFRITDLASAAVSHLEPRGVEFLVQDESAEAGQQFLEFYSSRLNPHLPATNGYTEAPKWRLKNVTRVRKTFPVADRIWSITSAPTENFRSAEGFANGANIVLTGGGLLTLTMTLFVFFTRAGSAARMKIEQELRESNHKLRVLFDQSPDIIMTVDENDQFIMINRPIPGKDGSDDTKSLARFFPARTQENYRKVLTKVFQSGEPGEIQFSGDDNHWWELRIVPLRIENSAETAMVILKDITERRMLEAHTIRNARLASLGVLAASVAHEINNPNNAIKFNASILSRSWCDILKILTTVRIEYRDYAIGGVPLEQAVEMMPRLLEGIANSAQRIQVIVGNLKHMARSDQGELDHEVEVAEVLRTALSILQNQIRMLCDACRLEIEEPLPVIRGNSQQLEQVFINVILNALQALPHRSAKVHIRAALEAEGEYIRVTVSDQGAGIPEEIRSKVFDPFFTTKNESEGTGLGLSISYRIIQKHRGRMALKSKPTKGTDVIMHLPVLAGTRQENRS